MAKLAGGVLLIAMLLAACGGRSSSGPAWPKSAGRVEVSDPAKDGGESLEPDVDMHVAAIERAEDKTPAGESIVVESAAPTPAAQAEKPTDAAKSPDSEASGGRGPDRGHRDPPRRYQLRALSFTTPPATTRGGMDAWLARNPHHALGDDGEPLPGPRLPAAGKRTLTQQLGARATEYGPDDGLGYLTHSIQMEAAGRGPLADNPFAIHVTARAGVRGGGGALPHLDAIQRSFGHHDVAGVRAHVGGAAAEASAAIGAHAYATGDDVAFAGAPDLRQAAHEAAHVVQQRGDVRLDGGVGRAGDLYEQHADAVADLVVRGESAEPLLDTMAHRGAAGGPAVQCLTHEERLAARTAASTDLSLEQLAHRMAYLDSVDALSVDDRRALTAQGFDVAGIRAHAGASSGAGDLQFWTFPAARDATVRVTPVIAFRGTESLADLSEDATAAGVGMAQFTMNQAAIQAAIHEIGDGRGVVATGHSLGGALAQANRGLFLSGPGGPGGDVPGARHLRGRARAAAASRGRRRRGPDRDPPPRRRLRRRRRR